MKPHEVIISTAMDGRVFASCITCRRQSKQEHGRKAANAWRAEHIQQTGAKP